jgi:hypothetical protein
MERRPASDDGSMGVTIALLILVIILSLVMYTTFILPGYTSGKESYSGMKRVTDKLVVEGAVAGYADPSGLPGQVTVGNPRPAPTSLGAVRIKVRLQSVRMMWQTGTGVDLSSATVTITSPAGKETLPRTTQAVMKKPSWKIVEKGSILPGHDDNGNDLLEPNEFFVLFICPSVPLPPGTPFTIIIEIPDENALAISRIVPDPVIPVMDLG